MSASDQWNGATIARISNDVAAALAENLIMTETPARVRALTSEAPGTIEERLLLRRERVQAWKADSLAPCLARLRIVLTLDEGDSLAVDEIMRSYAEAIDALPERS